MITRAVVVLFVAARVAYAQPATVGSVRGQLVDRTSGGPAAGAIVIATSESLQGEQSAIGDERGAYFLTALPPGVYRLTVYYLNHQFSRREVLVQLGKQVVVNFDLDTAAQPGEVITIYGRAPLVDQSSTKLGATFTPEYTRNVPTGRLFGDVVGAAAGAQNDRYGISIAGTTSPETAYYVDGIAATDPLFATLSTQLPTEFIAETEVVTGGYDAEFGRSTGGVVNVVTKRGSDAFHGSVFAHYTPAALAADATTIQREGSAIDTRTVAGDSYDVGGEIGGPLVRKRLWFHAGFMPRVSYETRERIISRQVDHDQDGVPDVDPLTDYTVHEHVATTALPLHSTTYFFTAKLTGAVDEHHQGEVVAFGNPSTATEIPFGIVRAPATLLWDHDYGSYNVAAKWTSKLAGATQLDATAGFHRTYDLPHARDERPQVRYGYERSLADFADVETENLDACRDSTVADGTDLYPEITNCPVFGYAEQGHGVIESRRDNRVTLALSVTHRAKLAGYHVIKLGSELERASDQTAYHFTGGYALGRGPDGRMGAPGRWQLIETMRVVRNLTAAERANPSSIMLGAGQDVCPDRDAVCALADPVHTSTSQADIGTYLQDSWLIAPSLTLNAGVRWDHQVGYVADDVVGLVTPKGDTVGARVFALDNFAPRVGVIHDPTGEGRGKLFAHYGRFYETLPLTASDLFANAMFTRTTLNVNRLQANTPRFDPNCTVDHGTPDLTDTIRACTDRSARDGLQAFEFVSPGLRGQYTDEIVLGAEYEVRPDLKLAAGFQHRTVPVVIEDVSMDGGNTLFITNPGESFDAEAAELHARAVQLAGSSDLRDRQLAETYETRAQWLADVDRLDKPIRTYNALQLVATLRPTPRALLLASYTYSANRGNYAGLFSPETGQLLPNLNAFFDLPSLLPNRNGILGLDRPHNLHADGFYRFDLARATALTVGASMRVQSGIAYSALAAHPAYGGSESYLLPAGGVGRTPVTGQVDVHVAFARGLVKSASVEAFVDVFNLFNAQSETAVDQRYTLDTANQVVGGTIGDLAHVKAIDPLDGTEQNRVIEKNPNFAHATGRQQPRAIQLGLRWLF